MVEWIRENGGYFSEKILFRQLDPNADDSPNGLFALDHIEKDETLMVIPVKCLLSSDSICGTARALVEEYYKGENSFFRDYVQYLFEDESKRKQLPDRWSEEAQDILRMYVGDELYLPFGDRSFEDDCDGEGEDPIEEDAYDFVVSRSWNEVMIPVYDMVNHKVSSRYR